MSLKKNELISAANTFFQQGRWDKAIEKYNLVLEIEPKNFNVFNMLGDCYLGRGDNANAFEVYLKAADILIEQGLINKAIAIYKKVLRIYPDNFDIYGKLANCYVQNGLIGEANALYLKLGEMYTKEKMPQEAMVAYRKIAELNPNNVLIRIKLAEMFAKQGIINEAVSEFLQIAEKYQNENQVEKQVQLLMRGKKIFPQNAEFFIKLGEIYFERGDYQGAVVELKEACNLLESAEVLQKLALCAVRIDDRDLFENNLEKLVSLDPDNPGIKLLQGFKAAYAGDAESAYNTVSEINESLLEEGKIKEAGENARDMETILGDTLEVQKLYFQFYDAQDEKEDELVSTGQKLAFHHHNLGQVEDAEKVYKHVLEKYSYRKDVREGAPVPVAEKKDEAPKQVEEVEAKSVELLLEEANELAQQGIFEEAIDIYQDVISEEPSNREACYQLGLVHKRLGNYEEAVKSFSKYLENDNQNVRVWASLGEVYQELGQTEEAIVAFERAVELDDSLISVLNQLEKIYIETGNDEKLNWCRRKQGQLSSFDATPTGLEEVSEEEVASSEYVASAAEEYMPEEYDEQVSADSGEAESVSEEELLEIEQVSEVIEEVEKPESLAAEPVADVKTEEIKPLEVERTSDIVEETTEPETVSADSDEVEPQAVAATTEEPAGIEQLEPVTADFEPYEDSVTSEIEPIVVEQSPQSEEDAELRPAVGKDGSLVVEDVFTPPQSETDISGIDLAASEAEVAEVKVEPTGEIELDQPEKEIAVEEKPSAEEVAASKEVTEDLEYLEEVEEYGEDTEKIQQALEQAKIFLNHHINDKAAAECKKVLDLDPDNVEAQQILLQLKEKMSARDKIKDQDLEPPEKSAQALEGGTRSISVQEENILDQLMDEEVVTPVFHESELDSKSLDDIIADFKTGVIEEGEDEDYDNHFKLGLAFKDMGLYDEAIGEFQIAAKDEEHYSSCCEMLGDCYLEKGIYSLAVEELSNGLELATGVEDKIKFKYKLGIAYEKNGHIDQAIEMYESVAAENSDYEQVATRLELAKKSKN